MSTAGEAAQNCWRLTQSRAAVMIDRRLAAQLKDTARALRELHRLTRMAIECSPPPGDGLTQLRLPNTNNQISLKLAYQERGKE